MGCQRTRNRRPEKRRVPLSGASHSQTAFNAVPAPAVLHTPQRNCIDRAVYWTSLHRAGFVNCGNLRALLLARLTSTTTAARPVFLSPLHCCQKQT